MLQKLLELSEPQFSQLRSRDINIKELLSGINEIMHLMQLAQHHWSGPLHLRDRNEIRAQVS